MNQIVLELEEELLGSLEASGQSPQQAIREVLILELYRRGRISSGKAAELLGKSRFDFIRYASKLGIAFFDLSEEEWAAEEKAVEQLS